MQNELLHKDSVKSDNFTFLDLFWVLFYMNKFYKNKRRRELEQRSIYNAPAALSFKNDRVLTAIKY